MSARRHLHAPAGYMQVDDAERRAAIVALPGASAHSGPATGPAEATPLAGGSVTAESDAPAAAVSPLPDDAASTAGAGSSDPGDAGREVAAVAS